MRKFTLNEKTYSAVDMNFNTVCDLEDFGVSLEQYATKPMAFMRAYVALSANMSAAEVGKEIEAHITNGGTLTEISDVINAAVEESGFFRALTKRQEKENQTDFGEATTETKPKKSRAVSE